MLKTFDLVKYFDSQEWTHFLGLKDLMYPRLTRLFTLISTLKVESLMTFTFFSEFKGIDMHLDCVTMSTILKSPNFGHKYFLNNDFCHHLRVSSN